MYAFYNLYTLRVKGYAGLSFYEPHTSKICAKIVSFTHQDITYALKKCQTFI